MSRIYIILALVLVLLAGGLLFLPASQWSTELEPEVLFKEINDPARFVTVDYVAERLINEDPAIMLVDVRPTDEAGAFTLPAAVNIPIAEINRPEWRDYLDQNQMDVVFYSNGDLSADQAWILCTRKGYKNLYVMSGGLNEWFSTIMQPVEPPATASSSEFEKYAFRKAASFYFGGGAKEAQSGNTSEEPVILVKRKKKSAAEGGC